MTSATTRSTAEELWTSLAGEDADEAVFSVLNLDHDRFLTELALYPGVVVAGESGGDGDAARARVGSAPRPGAARGRAEHRKARARLRAAEDVKMGGCCQLLRANIQGLRRYRGAGGEGRAGLPAEQRAARVLQAAWRAHVFRHVFLHLRVVVAHLSSSSARAALQSVNPREALLADAASDIVVRFRLAADTNTPLPVVVYKVFTRRPVVDVCRGCCGRLVLCSSAARAAAGEALGVVRVATAPAGGVTRPCCRPRSVCCLLFSSYKRVENNPWRPCRVGLFDPERCPARGTGLARIRGRSRAQVQGGVVRTSPPARARPAAAASKRKLSPQEKERMSKLSLLRRLYGYERAEDEVSCPPPPPSLSSRAPPGTPENDAILPPSPYDGRPRHHLLREVADDLVEAPLPRGRCLGASSSDSYYDSLLAAWGM